MNQQNIIQFYPNISAELIPKLQTIYQNENLRKYHAHVQSIKSKFLMPVNIPKITFPNTDNIMEFFLQEYQPITLDKQVLVEKENFKIKLFKNAIYFGEMNQEMRQGTGVLIRDNNNVYEGQFALDKKDGIGFEILKSDTFYYGHYVQGVPNGEGVYKSPSHNYIGQWQHGKKCGVGWCSSNKQDYYLGTWENGKFFGLGLHISDAIFFGEIINDLKFGYGEEYFQSGNHYIGSYKNGQPNGKGKFVWSNGNKYEGEFQNGLRWGEGQWEEKTDKGWSFYNGQYVNDKKNGYGHFKYANGTEYKGEFQDDFRHGYGEIIWPNKATYKGYWHRGLLEGEGIYNQDHKQLQGLWRQNQFITSQKVRMSLNQFPINNQLKDIKEDEEILSQLAEEPDFLKIGEQFNKRNIQSKTSFYTSELNYQHNLIQKQYDELLRQSLNQKQEQHSQQSIEKASIGIQTEQKEKKKLLTELPQIIVKKRKIQQSYSVEHKKQRRRNIIDSITNTNSPNTRESELQYSVIKNKSKKQRQSLLTKIEEKVLKLKLEKEKLSPYKFEKLWNQKVVQEARMLIYPPIWIPPSYRPPKQQ